MPSVHHSSSVMTFSSAASILLLLLSVLFHCTLTASFQYTSSSLLHLSSSVAANFSQTNDACPSSTECFPDLVYAIGGVQSPADAGCARCYSNATCDRAWMGQPGSYCGAGSGQATVNGAVEQFSFLGFCCPTSDFACVGGYAINDTMDPTFTLRGYMCIKRDAGLNTAYLWSLILLLAAVVGALGFVFYLHYWRGRGGASLQSGFGSFVSRWRRQRDEAQHEDVQPAAAASGISVVAEPAAPAQPFRLDHSVNDASAYQRME